MLRPISHSGSSEQPLAEICVKPISSSKARLLQVFSNFNFEVIPYVFTRKAAAVAACISMCYSYGMRSISCGVSAGIRSNNFQLRFCQLHAGHRRRFRFWPDWLSERRGGSCGAVGFIWIP